MRACVHACFIAQYNDLCGLQLITCSFAVLPNRERRAVTWGPWEDGSLDSLNLMTSLP